MGLSLKFVSGSLVIEFPATQQYQSLLIEYFSDAVIILQGAISDDVCNIIFDYWFGE